MLTILVFHLTASILATLWCLLSSCWKNSIKGAKIIYLKHCNSPIDRITLSQIGNREENSPSYLKDLK